jgi:hypothetical protein
MWAARSDLRRVASALVHTHLAEKRPNRGVSGLPAQAQNAECTAKWFANTFNRPAAVANKIGRRVSLRAVELLNRFVARREEACGRSDVDVRDEQPLFTVWLVAEKRPIGPHHR